MVNIHPNQNNLAFANDNMAAIYWSKGQHMLSWEEKGEEQKEASKA